MENLIFVYNAKSGFVQEGVDFFHKIISPDTYQCNLCKITHGMFMERSKWKAFRKNGNVDMKFYYKDEFEKKFDVKHAYPVILLENDALEVLLDSQKINQIHSIEALIEAIDDRLT